MKLIFTTLFLVFSTMLALAENSNVICQCEKASFVVSTDDDFFNSRTTGFDLVLMNLDGGVFFKSASQKLFYPTLSSCLSDCNIGKKDHFKLMCDLNYDKRRGLSVKGCN